MGDEFWRTVRKAIEEDNRTVRLIVILLTIGAMALIAYLLASR
ncbi:phage shock protein PspC (stress-responsive transcriptional regulator) [Streptomyces achromogenes]|uniref:Phage shock protein PspC (Stress-responsive transcriptional regulator) n=1 Tax=Streptomyces achromogenes TaxID=67255 RepID=A0ABU0PY55_STRAH|nr:phage shock protein PspC (stress-responsive transcriptional regulator) [Streptomyces achromogenes]MDQ0830547.1 phage shock protein PspC (stress-responsive transcriptional regulator) [Streptomyces achromogenes]